jgi:hypothetical protein
LEKALTLGNSWQWWVALINNQTNNDMNEQLTELIYDLVAAVDAATGLTDTAREAVLATLPQVNVYACKVDQAYGGREEGGWYYRTEQPLDRHIGRDSQYWGYTHPERLTMRADKAIAYCERANYLTDIMVNAERPSLSSVASIGKIHWQWTADRPRCQPESRPYYC